MPSITSAQPQVNQPIGGETRGPAVVVDAGLPRGRHRFRLEVVNARGQRGRPAEVIVTAVGDRRPAAPRSGPPT
jgi:hypothetical protein